MTNEVGKQPTTSGHWASLGRLAYDKALDIQMAQRHRLLNGEDDRQTIFAVEHPPTITIGKNGGAHNIVATKEWLEQSGFEVRTVDRGGDVTYHGPGQWVVYPVLHLHPWNNDVSKYIRLLEESIITALAEVGISGERSEGYPGVWVEDRKICAVGASVRRNQHGEFVTAHGLALNVTTDLSDFQTIVPCGIADRGVTSVEAEINGNVTFSEWEGRLKRSFTNVFQLSFE
ncbi:lipoyl(octanoyl) transferase LipB [Alicyclobacillus sp. SO9]|nr:lipoyl(octanoyl) transferase LipB [Alicyclobacillus sp. SO9]